jgi:hypothetical protein
MALAANKIHLYQEELSKGDKEKLKTFGEWLSKKERVFEAPKGGLQKCVDPQLRDKLEELFKTVDFTKEVGSPVPRLSLS